MKKLLTSTLILLMLLFSGCTKQITKESSTSLPSKQTVYNRQATDFFLKAMQFKETGNLFGAVVEFQNAYKYQKDPYIQQEIAECYFYLKQFDNAQAAIEIAILEKPMDEDLLFWKLKILQADKKNAESANVLNALITINPSKIEYYYYLMEIEYGSGDLAKTGQTIKSALKIATTKSQKRDLYARLADLALMDKKTIEAENTYKEYLLSVDSSDIVMLTQFSRVLFTQEKFTEAIAVQKKILAVDNENIEQHNMLFLMENNYGSKQEAELTLLNAVKKFNDDGLKLNLGRFYAEKPDTAKANLIYRSLLKSDSGDVLIYNELAGMYDKSGDKKSAVNVYKTAYAAFPDNHSILNNYAYILSEIDIDLHLALELSKKSLAIDPDSPSYLDTYGWINFKLGNYSEAERYLLKAIANDTAKTQLFVLYEHLGDIKAKQAKNQDALECYQKAQALNPKVDFTDKIRALKLNK